MFKTATKRRFWRLTALPTTAAATAVHGGSWWLAGLFTSFSLLPCTLSLLLPSCRALPLPFSLFSFPFSLGFSLVFPFFSFLPFFSLFSFLSQVNKWPHLGWIQPLMDANNGWLSQQVILLILSLKTFMIIKRKRRFRSVKCRFRIYLKRCLMPSILVHINCTDKLSWPLLAPFTPSVFFSVYVPGYFVFLSGTVKSL